MLEKWPRRLVAAKSNFVSSGVIANSNAQTGFSKALVRDRIGVRLRSNKKQSTWQETVVARAEKSGFLLFAPLIVGMTK